MKKQRYFDQLMLNWSRALKAHHEKEQDALGKLLAYFKKELKQQPKKYLTAESPILESLIVVLKRCKVQRDRNMERMYYYSVAMDLLKRFKKQLLP